MGAERRIDQRFCPKELTYVAVRPEFSRLGKVVDISVGGLCFQYMTQQEVAANGEPLLDVDLFISDNGYYLPSLTCKKVHEVKVKQQKGPDSDINYRRCGVRFLALTDEQADQIGRYLEQHTTELVE
jgi:c-di-GMP-binding flagellar brake protein YcgR